ncbi:MAG: hypothetical protein WAX89_08045 [Alphaproteobacteria bacterium]
MVNIAPHTPALSPAAVQQALAVALADLQRCGVTDIVGNTAISWFDAAPLGKDFNKAPAAPAPAARATAAVAPAVAKPIHVSAAKPKMAPVKVMPAEDTPIAPRLWWVGDAATAPAVVVLGATAAHAQSGWPLSAEEKELLGNMLKAIGLDIHTVACLAVTVADAAETPYTATQLAPLNAVVAKELAAPRPTLLFGPVVAQLATGKDVPLAQLRTMAATQPLLAGRVTGVTYHPRTLLKQPTFKRMAWQDLLAFQLAQNVQTGLRP